MTIQYLVRFSHFAQELDILIVMTCCKDMRCQKDIHRNIHIEYCRQLLGQKIFEHTYAEYSTSHRTIAAGNPTVRIVET